MILFAAGCLSRAGAQEHINFTSLTTRDGLSSSTVTVILKDRFGLLWLGTEDGLDKFDGTHITVYRHKADDTTSLRSNEILSLHEDRSGNLWVGTSGGSLSLYDRKRDAFINFTQKSPGYKIRNNVIRGITSDEEGKIWLVHYSGVDILDPRSGRVTTLPELAGDGNLFSTRSGLSIFADSRRRIWIGTSDGLLQYNPATRALKQYRHVSHDPSSGLSGNTVTVITEDRQGDIWIGTNGGVSRLKPGADRFIHYVLGHYINTIAVDGDSLWLGTNEGLHIMHANTGRVSSLAYDSRQIHGLTASHIRYIYIDNQGIYWIGTAGGGINKYDKNLNLFNLVRSNVFDSKGLNVPIVNAFAEGPNGKVFVGTEGGGLHVFDAGSRLFERVSLKSSSERLAVLALEYNRQKELVIGTYAEGIFIMNPVTKRYRQLTKGKGLHDLNSNDIFCLKRDSKGQVWVGTNGDGINVMNAKNEVIVRYTPHPVLPNDILLPFNGFIRDIEEDSDGNIWIATHGGGVARFQPPFGQFTLYTTENGKLPNDKVQTLMIDRRGHIWAGTFGNGIAIINRHTNEVQTYSEKNGLQNNTIYKIIEDNNGLIWVSSNKGICSIDPVTQKISTYNYHNGVQNGNFVHESGVKLASGELFFGGQDGFNYFHPNQLRKNRNIPSVLITSLSISNRPVTPSEHGPIRENISIARHIYLDHKQNFALSFVGLNFTAPEQNQYAYKLEGFDKDWNYVGNTNTVSYTNLDPGEYVFRVKASNNDGVWNNTGTLIHITVRPPFWRTTYAYILYILAITGILMYTRYRGIQKMRKQFAMEQMKLEAKRVHELDQLKIKFLTNLSHEFRTPISLILGPADKLRARINDAQAAGDLHMITRNAKRLLNLVNQLLDFQKMEEHELQLQATEGELVSFVQDVCDSFRDLSERKKIEFVYTPSIDKYHSLFDHNKIERILFNVISNAFKFTLEGGKIVVELLQADTAPGVVIRVRDTGIGIPEDKKEKIFDRFFQHTTAASILNQGSGIGLSITREFVRLHGGTIDVDSSPGKGTTFCIQLPLVQLETVEAAEVEDVAETAPAVVAGDTTNAPAVLLVEDDADFRVYLKDHLSQYYKVVEAVNGKEGWRRALSHHPQLIVSDVSMPEMDGIELTKKIKTDKRTNNIPVVLLTALTGEANQLAGLGTGANDYITKPFNFDILNAKIKNLLTLNDISKNTYSRQIKVETPEMNIEQQDEKLLKKIALYLEENLTDPQLSVEELSRHAGMSRSTLYSKILELTGLTPVEYIRSVKLDKAAVLLEKSDMNVAQIAYSVGFATPKYFTRSFKARFNMLPSEYKNRMRN
jgi:Signal transduction histidine kinase